MNSLKAVSGARMLVAALVAAAGLMASAPQVHGTVESRGAVACNINVIATPDCGSKANYLTCYTNYTKCKSFQGPKDKVCTIAPVSSCKVDTGCNIQTDYIWSTNCSPTASALSVTGSSSIRPSQVQ